MARPQRARYEPDPKSFRKLMTGPEMQALMGHVAETTGKPAAVAASPSDTGEYRESFKVETGISDVGDRAEARIINTAAHAPFVEMEHNVLSRAADAIEGA